MTPDIRKERETALYEAALRLIAKGVNPAAMKVQQIADEAGIGKGTVYEYFASKDEILQGMALYCFDTEIARIESTWSFLSCVLFVFCVLVSAFILPSLYHALRGLGIGGESVFFYLHFPPIQQPAAPPWNIPTGRAAGCFYFCLFMGSVRGGSTRAGFVWALARPGAWKHSTALSAHPPQRKAEPDHSNHPAGRG